jgi:hypothetical protein
MQHGPPVELLIPLFGMITGIVITGMVIIGPVGRAISYWLGGGHRKEPHPALPAEMDEVHDRLDVLSRQIAEVVERQEFTERLLAKSRQERALPGAGGAEG